MNIPVIMPQLGLTMTEGSVSEWLKKPGDIVRKGEMLFIVSTDKTDMEVESLDEGKLAEILVPRGKTVPVGTVIAYLEGAVEAPVLQPARGQAASATPAPPVLQEQAPSAGSEPASGVAVPQHRQEGAPASPRARKAARELGVDISQVTPSGGSGRIVEEDVRRFAEASRVPATKASQLHIVVTDTGFPDADIEKNILAALDAEVTVAHCRTEEDVLAAARDADALLVQWAPLSRRVIEQLTRCRFISRFGVGVDMIDLEAAREHEIRVTNVPDFCVEEVASHTLGFLLALGRKIFWQDRLMRQGQWSVVSTIGPVSRFHGQTLGIIGVGRIGKRFAEMASPLGMRILGHDLEPAPDVGAVRFTDLDTVLREADFLSLHCPLTKDTHHLLDARAFSKMKPSAFLMNLARGGVVDTAALVDALEHGRIAGAALDVFEQEPLPPDHPLLKMENVLLTPHLASYSLQAAMQLRRDTAKHVVEFFQGTLKASLV
jgi:D-3-phosphoglycerate dehydrogenase